MSLLLECEAGDRLFDLRRRPIPQIRDHQSETGICPRDGLLDLAVPEREVVRLVRIPHRTPRISHGAQSGLARASARRYETVMKGALGATRGGLVRQSVTEGLVLASLGGVLGIYMATWGDVWIKVRLASSARRASRHSMS